jgi:hypothetical protein
VIDAMRAAGGNKERYTAGWIELSFTNKPLQDALTAVFKRMPTAQKFGLWLSENVGAQHGEYVLYGRHSSNAKAWRYSVRTPAELEELKAARQAAEEVKRAAAQEEQARHAERERIRAEQWAARQAAEQAKRAAKQAPPRPVYNAAQALEPGVSDTDRMLNPYMQPPEETPPVGYFIPLRPDADKSPDPQPLTRVEELRERYLASLHPNVSALPSWLDHGGIVAHNTFEAMLRQQPRRWYEGPRLCRGLVPWWGPGGRQ